MHEFVQAVCNLRTQSTRVSHFGTHIFKKRFQLFRPVHYDEKTPHAKFFENRSTFEPGEVARQVWASPKSQNTWDLTAKI